VNLKLSRTDFLASGIFGILTAMDSAVFKLYTLEHAYSSDTFEGVQTVSQSWTPKVPIGTYVCQRGFHRLDGWIKPIETFEILNVPGHTGILFHIGNNNRDSSGCVLLGERVLKQDQVSEMPGVYGSRNAFEAFMAAQDGVEQFTLVVE
jgi:hypothetical protein